MQIPKQKQRITVDATNLASLDRTDVIRVLHVDDDLSMLGISKAILMELGNFEIEHACCVDEAFEKLHAGGFDVVVSDYEMPQKDGLEFLRLLRERKFDVPFILFTGKGREEVAIRALNLGAEGYFNKQGDPETVYGELSHGIQLVVKQKVAEKRSREAEALRTTLLDNVPCIALILEKDTRKIMFSNKYAKEIGAVPGKTCYGTCARRSEPCLFCLAPKYWETKEPQSLEVEYEGKYYRGLWMPYNENLYVHYIFDITDRKMAEEKQKENCVQMEAMNEKLRIIGGLTRHDVRNKLFVMNSDLYLLKKSHADHPDLVEGVRRIQQAIKEIDRVFDFSKAYEQLGAEELRYVDVEKAINEVVGSFKSTLGTKIVNDCQGLSLFADSLLNQVFYTLFDNSIKHGKKAKIVRFYFERSDHGNLNLIYVDDGVGVPDANKSKIFNLGFSTYGSSGFGLYLIRRLMDVYGWTIEENGVSGNGAKFTISIPKSSQNGKKNFQLK